eukprot:TRINITY_DN6141_c0_g1_i12.p1 TRINITY_DN6141_c0_g1~~TRINITY_DN6141_c0_g1_i12.p1  ORF type:complete len:216 (-),score=63.92 TRINITY_DN6141_c0_g1_i12:2-589(-)
MCIRDRKRRVTVDQALRHPWFRRAGTILGGSPRRGSVDRRVINMLRGFRSTAKLRKEALRVMVNLLSENEIKSMKDAFKAIDKDNSGEIKLDELKQVMTEMGFNNVEREIEEILRRLGADRNMGINYSEFLTATLDSKIYLNEEKMWTTFKYFDVNNSNCISAVSYTHLTLPTIYSVQISVVAVSLKKKIQSIAV